HCRLRWRRRLRCRQCRSSPFQLLAFEMENYGTGGIGAGGATEGGSGGVEIPAPYIYHVPNIRVKQSSVSTNAGSSRAFRAPSNPPASFGMESIMDELAVKLNMDPVELRIKNNKPLPDARDALSREV